jgi:hypothetical protein
MRGIWITEQEVVKGDSGRGNIFVKKAEGAGGDESGPQLLNGVDFRIAIAKQGFPFRVVMNDIPYDFPVGRVEILGEFLCKGIGWGS